VAAQRRHRDAVHRLDLLDKHRRRGAIESVRPDERTHERPNLGGRIRQLAIELARCSSKPVALVNSPPPAWNKYLKWTVPNWLSCHSCNRIVNTGRPRIAASMNALVFRPTTTAL
jgi:hypothetical protein